jgi:hypothetical protein
MRPTKRTVSQVGLGEVTRCLSQVHGEWLGPAYCAGQPHMVCDLHHISLAVNLECSRPAVVGRPGHNLITPRDVFARLVWPWEGLVMHER